MQTSRALAVAAVLAAFGVAGVARAQESAPTSSSTKPGFGNRSSGIFALENVFGISSTTESISQNGQSQSHSYDDKGFLPGFLGPRLSIHGVSNGWTYGAVLGAWWVKPVGKGSDNSGSLLSFTIGPRIGYAGSLPKQPMFGYWVRTGPTVMFIHSETGGSTSTSRNSGSFDWSIDAYGVVSPADHFAVFFGPSFDIAIYGRSSGTDDKLGVINFGIGLLADW